MTPPKKPEPDESLGEELDRIAHDLDAPNIEADPTALDDPTFQADDPGDIDGPVLDIGLVTRYANGLTAGGDGLVIVVLANIEGVYEPVGGTLAEHDDPLRALRHDATNLALASRVTRGLGPDDPNIVVCAVEVDTGGALLHVLTHD